MVKPINDCANIHNNKIYTIRTENELTDYFQFSRGIRHIHILILICEITTNNTKIHNLRYTDDTWSIASSEEDLETLISYQ